MSKKILTLIFSFLLLAMLITGCAKQEVNEDKSPSTAATENTATVDNQIDALVIDDSTYEVEELDDASLDELDNIDLSNW